MSRTSPKVRVVQQERVQGDNVTPSTWRSSGMGGERIPVAEVLETSTAACPEDHQLLSLHRHDRRNVRSTSGYRRGRDSAGRAD